MSQPKLLVCDVCDTLYQSNTTFDFIRYFLKKRQGIKLFLFLALTSKKAPILYFMLLMGRILRKDFVKRLALTLLKGETRSEIESEAQSFYFDVLEGRLNENVLALLKTHRTTKILLVSSSIDPVVKVIGERNGFQFVSSRLEWRDERSTGRLTDDLTGIKHEIVMKIMQEEAFAELVVVTDNRSDWLLVRMANERFVVLQNARDKDFWSSLSPAFLFVNPPPN
jgi:phosphoserine phosphatase